MEKIISKSWNEKFKDFCVANGWDLEDVSKKTGFSMMTISYWQRGVIKPTKENQKILVQKLGLDIKIFEGMEKNRSSKLKWNEKFKFFCVANGWKYTDVAKMTGFEPSTISGWWRGMSKPREASQEILAHTLGLNIRIFDEDNDFDIFKGTRKLKWNNKFKAFCILNGWTLQDVSKKTAFAPATISLWYQGKRRPSYESQLILADKLGLSIELFYEEDK